MIDPAKLRTLLKDYRSAYEASRQERIKVTLQASGAFRLAWDEWSRNPSDRNGLFQCIDALKIAVEVFSGIYNYTYVFGGKRGGYNYGMLGLMSEDLEGEVKGTGATLVHEMFATLFEPGDIKNRYVKFADKAEQRVERIRLAGKLKESDGHLQQIHPASVYCWLKSPADHYYFFTNEYVNLCVAALGAPALSGRRANFLESVYAYMQELKTEFLREWHDNVSDEELSALVCDFVDYVGSTVREQRQQPTSGCWLLVANPKQWSFASLAEGEEVSYSLVNEEGKKRQIFKNFMAARIGDKVACYESSPACSLVAFAEVSAEQDGTCIRFKKTCNLETPVPLADLKAHAVLRERFEHIQGSLFDLSREQYAALERMTQPAMRWQGPHNRILFGAPGTGKSYLLNEDAVAYFEESRMERVTFHPEYTSFDFIGSYMPTVQGRGTAQEHITYSFVPGPFARVLRKALLHPETPYLLLIEEINRANAASVFADIFQLLDRDKKGQSLYFITPTPHLAEYLGLAEDAPLRLPDNLYLWASMNSADQGVFPMDTAFKRRWNYEYCGIDDAKDALLSVGYCAADWNKLRNHVNKLLQHAGVNEDKQMGPFFLSAVELETVDSFLSAVKSKVLMYLYEDAARHKRAAVFKKSKARYSELCAFSSCEIEEIIEELFLEITEG
ncbi:MAG: AAA family ATPase [Akkermansia sp.]|nr:AAA family ATPase [Akkermansia sp.]